MVRGLEAVYQGRPEYGHREAPPPAPVPAAEDAAGRLQLVTGPERRRT
jgi:hypothetical protein